MIQGCCFFLQLKIRWKPFHFPILWKRELKAAVSKVDTKYWSGPLFTVEDFSRDLRNICMTKFAMLTNVCLTEPLSSLMNPNEKILGQSTRSMRVFQNVIANTNSYIQIQIFTGALIFGKCSAGPLIEINWVCGRWQQPNLKIWIYCDCLLLA